MHHINHVRKNKYSLIPNVRTWEQMMHLRNRKQIPVCRVCHKSIHDGEYSGARLTAVRSQRPYNLFDNRIVHLENFVKKDGDRVYSTKPLECRGWIRL